MPPRTLAELLASLPTSLIEYIPAGTESVIVTAPVVESSRDVQPGGVFVARPGLTVDGHDFMDEVIAQGVVAVVGQRARQDVRCAVPYIQVRDAVFATGYLSSAYYDHPSRRLVVVGVTGTDGKTTTSHLVHSILQQMTGGHTGFISTIAADLGGEQVGTGLHVTTPTAPEIQHYLAQMVARGLTHVVLEATSHGLALGRMSGVDLDVAVMTNVMHEHLDFHGNWEAYRAAKGRLFQMLADRQPRPGQPTLAIINRDDASYDYFAGLSPEDVISYGIENAADLEAHDIAFGPGETRFTVGDVQVRSPLIGQFNVYNMLAAIGVGRGLGATNEQIQAGIGAVTGISGRMQRIDEGQAFIALVDFAHTPNALRRALEAGRTMLTDSGRLIAVFGSAGLRDVEKRRLMAETSAQLADITLLTAEDPRTEALDDILEMMAEGCRAQGGMEGETFYRIPDRGVALLRACQMARPGDVVMACGKGHEQSMCFGTIEYPWDDRDALRSALRGVAQGGLPTSPTAASSEKP